MIAIAQLVRVRTYQMLFMTSALPTPQLCPPLAKPKQHRLRMNGKQIVSQQLPPPTH